MKNLRITKIITALIIIIWVPSSFADFQSLTEITRKKFTITNGTAQVNFAYFADNSVKIKSCQDRRNCKVFWTDSAKIALIMHYTEEEKDELFKKLSKDFEKKRPIKFLTMLNKRNVPFMLMSIGASLKLSSPASLTGDPTIIKVIDPVTIAKLSMQSDYLKNKYDIPTQNNFYNYLSKLKIVKKIVLFKRTDIPSIYIRIEVEDKVIKDFIKALEQVFVAETKRASE